MSDEEECSNVPDRDTCQKLIEEFVAVTQSNEAIAQQFLQESDWKLCAALSGFYDALALEEGSNAHDVTVIKTLFEGKTWTSEPPPRLLFISWNLDCLDELNLKRRMMAVIGKIKKQEPDVVFFQEVIPEVAAYFDRKLPEYQGIRGNSEGYFTMILIRFFTVKYDSHEIVPFPQSRMGRNLLVCKAHVGKRNFAFLNTHLESGKEFSEERQLQLKKAFDIAKNYPIETTVIFGGDLNLRDKEEMTPSGFFDAWRMCGSQKECQYTWDMMRNTNKEGFGKFKPRMRFDRVYVRPEHGAMVRPKYFGLIGAERAPLTQSFPSDHWGVVVVFDLKH